MDNLKSYSHELVEFTTKHGDLFVRLDGEEIWYPDFSTLEPGKRDKALRVVKKALGEVGRLLEGYAYRPEDDPEMNGL